MKPEYDPTTHEERYYQPGNTADCPICRGTGLAISTDLFVNLLIDGMIVNRNSFFCAYCTGEGWIFIQNRTPQPFGYGYERKDEPITAEDIFGEI